MLILTMLMFLAQLIVLKVDYLNLSSLKPKLLHTVISLFLLLPNLLKKLLKVKRL